MLSRFKPALPYVLVIVWFTFTASLAGWWYIFAIEQTQRLIDVEHASSPGLAKHLSMLRWEGLTLVICIVLGAAGMTYYIFREMRHSKRLQDFLSTFTHELKTPLASLRLQAESLLEDLSSTPQSQLAARLVSDTERLTLQLENSLFLAQQGSLRLLKEPIAVNDFIQTLQSQWPEIQLVTSADGSVLADRRAFDCILRNLIHNALVHGKASRIDFSVETEAGRTRIVAQDNGMGLRGDRKLLGKEFARLYPGSGNGIGLYIVSRLMHDMNGKVFFPQTHSTGFAVGLELIGAHS